MKQTPLLKAVLSLLETHHKPLSVPDLRQLLLDQNLEPNKTTLYRMLENLAGESQVERLLLDPKVTYYELKTHHHHHFRCGSCETIECVTDSELEAQIHSLESKLQAKGMEVSEHHFSLSGICASCN